MELQYEDEMTEEEVEARADVFESRVSHLEYMNREEKVFKEGKRIGKKEAISKE